MYPMKLKPIYDKTIWANHRLTNIRGIKEEGYGTCWEVSAHPYAQSSIENGEFAGRTLQSLMDVNCSEILGIHPFEKMLRLAYLDAKEDLSIQVHPYNAYAIEHEQDMGKTESWYILEADENATLVAGTTIQDKEVIAQAIKDKTLDQYLVKVPVKAGDFIYIEAGMLHALGAGIFAIEIGTNSNVTYRFYDYGRVDQHGNERELHLKKGFDVVDLSKKSNVISTPVTNFTSPLEKTLVDEDEFEVKLYDVVDEITFDTNGKDFHCLSFVNKDATIEWNGVNISVQYSDTMFIPASCGAYTIKGPCRLLKSLPK